MFKLVGRTIGPAQYCSILEHLDFHLGRKAVLTESTLFLLKPLHPASQALGDGVAGMFAYIYIHTHVFHV